MKCVQTTISNLQTPLNHTSILSRQNAEQYLKDTSSCNLSDYTGIDDDAAEILSKFEGHLWLSFTSISDTAAEALAKHQKSLCFSNISTLTNKAAEALSKHQGMLAFPSLA